MESWINHPNVTAVVWAGLPGQESGNTLTSVLYGDYNPSGKLTFTIARNASDYGQQLLYQPNAPIPQHNFTSTNIDYRHFDAAGITPRYEFGYGLSYTTFNISAGAVKLISNASYSPRSSYPTGTPAADQIPSTNTTAQQALFPANFTKVKLFEYPNIDDVSEAEPSGTYPYPYAANATLPKSPAGGGQGGNPSLYDVIYSISATVTNTGTIAGSEVVQLYVSYPNSTEFPSPPNQLRGFEKVYIEPRATASVSFDVTRKELSVWNVVSQNWQFVNGEYTFRLGNSSRQLTTVGTVTLS